MYIYICAIHIYIYIICTYIHYMAWHCIAWHDITLCTLHSAHTYHVWILHRIQSSVSFCRSCDFPTQLFGLSMRHFSLSTCEEGHPTEMNHGNPVFSGCVVRAYPFTLAITDVCCLYGMYRGGCFSLFPPFLHLNCI